jgi:hypothetical protein
MAPMEVILVLLETVLILAPVVKESCSLRILSALLQAEVHVTSHNH